MGRGAEGWVEGHVIMTEAEAGDALRMEEGATSHGIQVATRS